jgi:hypothetical protein
LSISINESTGTAAEMIKSLIDRVRVIANGWGEELEPPVIGSELEQFIDKVQYSYSVELPEQYKEFLQLANGLEFNGLIIYGTRNSENAPDASTLDFFEMNEVFQDSSRARILDVIAVGEDSTGVLTYDKDTQQFQYRDRIGLDRVETFSSFEKILEVEIEKVM